MDFLNWLPWIFGLGGVGIGLFYILGGVAVLGTLNASLGILSPIISGAKDFLSWYLTNMWEGISVIFKNTSTFIVIASIAAGTAYVATHQEHKTETAKCTVKIQKAQCKPKVIYKQVTPDRTTKPEWWDPFGIL